MNVSRYYPTASEAKTLAELVKLVPTVSPNKKSVSPVLRNICIKNARARITNLEVEVSFQVCKLPDCVIPPSLFPAISKGFSCICVEDATGKAVAVEGLHGGVYNADPAEGVPLADYPHDLFDPLADIQALACFDKGRIAKYAARAGKEMSRRVLMNVCVDFDNKAIVATDGRAMVWGDIPDKDMDRKDGFQHGLIPPAMLSVAGKVEMTCVKWAANAGKGLYQSVVSYGPMFEVRAKHEEGVYANWKHVIPSKSLDTAYLYLPDLVVAGKGYSDRTHALRLRDDATHSLVACPVCSAEDWREVAVIPLPQAKVEHSSPFDTCIKIEYAKALQAFFGKVWVDADYTQDGPLHFRSKSRDSDNFLLAPIMLPR